MKQFLPLALAALVLFSVSAALSVWLNRSPQPEDAGKDADKAAKKTDRPAEKDPAETRPAPRPADPGVPPDPTSPGALAAAKEREARLDRRAAQIDLILRDIQAQRETVEALLRQVTTELKQAAGKTGELEAKAADLEKRKVDLDAAEKKNIDRMAAMCDTMPPESAALILKQLADSGKLDTAVKVLAQMKDRQAARVLAEFGDPALAAQVLERMKGLRTNPPAPPGGVAPAGGVPPKNP